MLDDDFREDVLRCCILLFGGNQGPGRHMLIYSFGCDLKSVLHVPVE